jgi:hypothetical protein
MLVSLNLLCKWLIQLSPLTAVTGSSLFLTACPAACPAACPVKAKSNARIATKAFIDVIEQDVVDEDMLDQFFILLF